MLQGSVHSDEPTLVTVKRLGGSANGLTSYDHTGYYEAVPYTALEYAIWLEADRMGHFLDSLTQEKLDSQRSKSEWLSPGRVGVITHRAVRWVM